MIFDFGYRLRELREGKNMTQTQVARRLNLSKTTISGYENNIKTPSLDVLVNLSILYGVPTDYILGLENRKMILIDGITSNQEDLLKKLTKEFRDMNKRIINAKQP